MAGNSWITPKAKAKDGGLFAVDCILRGEIVCIFGGAIMTSDEVIGLPDRLSDYPIKIADGFYLGQRDRCFFDDAEYVNHSCDPSCEITNIIFLSAKKDIPCGDQITFDYEKNDGDFDGFLCKCGAASCRGYVGRCPKS